MIVRVTRHAREHLVGRLENDLAGGTVNDHELPWRNAPARIVKADDRRHLERAGENRGVIRAAPRVGREAADFRPIHLRGEGRGQLVGDEHRRFIQLAQKVARRRDTLSQVHLETTDQIGHVAFAFPQVGVGDLVEHGAELLEDLLEGPLGVDLLFADDVRHTGHEHRIVEHQELSVEERGHLRAAPPRDTAADVHQLLARPRPALLEPRQLATQARRRDLIAKHLRALNQNHGAPRHDPGRDADAFQALHTSSRKPDSTSVASASTASPSSVPSALIVIPEPRAAASRRMPMMLLPSISRESRATRTRAWNRAARWTNLAAALAYMPSWFTTVTVLEVMTERALVLDKTNGSWSLVLGPWDLGPPWSSLVLGRPWSLALGLGAIMR